MTDTDPHGFYSEPECGGWAAFLSKLKQNKPAFTHVYHPFYCRVPARWGLQQTTRAPDSDKTRVQGSFGPFTGGLKV